MNIVVPIAALVALLLLLMTGSWYGVNAFVFPFFFVSIFFAALAVMAWNAQIQTAANPGIEKIEEPSFWFSNIYNAWLYATDIERWAKYAAVISVFAAMVFGSLFGAFVWIAQPPSSGISVSWLVGMFLTVSVAFTIATADYWAEQSKRRQVSVAP